MNRKENKDYAKLDIVIDGSQFNTKFNHYEDMGIILMILLYDSSMKVTLINL